jgi:SAM-dependent methyltransferase
MILNNLDPILWKSISQVEELKIWNNLPSDYDDWNNWWKKHFDDYSFLKGLTFDNYIEVGCGPYAKNTINIFNVLLKNPQNIHFNDPLLNEYIKNRKSIVNLITPETKIESLPLEEIEVIDKKDCVVCVNVLDHVYDLNKCLQNIIDMTSKNGLLIFGQDLTNDEDHIKNSKESFDYTHPIRFDLNYIEGFLNNFKPIYKKILKREEGRNPSAHYATILFCGEKI